MTFTRYYRIAFIGGGNMAEALLGGLIRSQYPVERLTVADPLETRQEALRTRFPGLHVVETGAAAVLGDGKEIPASEIVVMAVKPQVQQMVATALAPAVQRTRPLILTIAAGIRAADLGRWLSVRDSAPLPIARAMPNTPALLMCGATGLYASETLDEAQRQAVFELMASVSRQTFWVQREQDLDTVTALSGSGPAYFFKIMGAMIRAAEQLGLPPDVARGLAAQTCVGAGQMVLDSAEDCAELQRRVTSPRGTTEAAIAVLTENNVSNAFESALLAAHRRSRELGDLLGRDAEGRL